MFKTGIITDEVSQDITVAISLAQEFHLDAIEIRSVDEKNPFQLTCADYHRIKALADDAGLEVCCVGSPFFKCDIDDKQTVAEHMEGLQHAVEGAHILGTQKIRGFAFWKSPNANEARISEMYEPVIRLMEQEDMVMALESEPSVNTGNMMQLASLLQTINHPRIRALFDPGNEICDHTAPPPYPHGYRVLKPYLAHVHIKDMIRTQQGYDPACIGKGAVDFRMIFSALKQDEYDGYATLETHWRMRERMDEELMTRPQGSDFSSGGERASRICLTILREQYGFGA